MIKTGLVAGADRSDGARLRLGDRDQRRRDHPRLRAGACRAARRRKSTRRSDPGRFGMAEETGRLLNAAINDGVRARPRHRPGGRRVAARMARRRTRSLSIARRRRRGSAIPVTVHVGDRHRHHPHASRRVRRGARRGQPARLPVLRVERRAARGGVYLNCGSAVVLPEVFLKAVALARNRGVVARRPDDRQPRFHPPVSAADQRRVPARRRHRQGLFARRPPRDHDSAARGGADRRVATPGLKPRRYGRRARLQPGVWYNHQFLPV